LAPTAQSGPFWAKKWVFWPEINFLSTSSNFFVTIMTRHQKDNVFVSLMLLSELLGGCKSPFLAQKWPENQIFMLSIVLHGIVWYCMEFLCILWYPIVFMSFHCIVWYCMVLYYILRYCMVLHCWLRRAGCISQDTYLLYIAMDIHQLQLVSALSFLGCFVDKIISKNKTEL